MAMLKWLIGAAAAFGGLVALMYVAQRSLMYFPERLRTPPAMAGLPEAQEVALDTKDGERVIVWHVPPRGVKPVVLYFHGNGGALRNRVARFHELIADGNGLIALSYRGYGGSTGRPTEAGLIADAEAAHAFAAEHYPAERIVLWGESLGSAVAVALGADHRAGSIVLEGSFTSAADVGAAHAYRFLPLRLLMKDQFRSDLQIPKVTAPLLFLHGGRDWVVPIALGERLYALANEPKQFVRFSDAGPTKRSTCTVRRMPSERSSCLFRRKCPTGRSRSNRLRDLSRDNERLSKVIRCPLYPQMRASVERLMHRSKQHLYSITSPATA